MTPELRALVLDLIDRPADQWPTHQNQLLQELARVGQPTPDGAQLLTWTLHELATEDNLLLAMALGIAARSFWPPPASTANGPPSLTPPAPISPISPITPITPPRPPMSSAGFLPCTDTSLRVVPSGWAPPPVGPFQFPEPWGTRACRITDDSQGARLEPVGYSYWRSINAHRDRDDLYVMLACPTPSLFAVNKTTLQPRFVRTLDLPVTGEQVYFSAHDPAILYVPMANGLYRVNVENGARSTVFEVDPRTYLWQAHSSDDERTHSATVRANDTYAMLGAVVHREGVYGPPFIPTIGEFDECAIDGTGDWCVIKETLADGLCNRIVRTANVRDSRTITKEEGALGHSDLGPAYILGENPNIDPANALVQWFVDSGERRLVYHGTAWSTGIGHISHTNVHDRRSCVISNASRDRDVPRQNEIIQVPLDGSLTFRPLAPSLADLDAPGGGDDYRKMPKGNLDPYGQYVCWTANHGGDHLDAFVLEVPPL